ncbi:MAG: hypothetical protein HDP34_02540 [Clostridia bacterium]|nr:hypothetical protein [Clostridia bacterium]
MNSAKLSGVLRKLLILLFAVTAIMCISLVGCAQGQGCAAQPPSGVGDGDDQDEDDSGDMKEWNVSATPVTAKLTENGEYYTLDISGSGDMKGWTKAEDVPWYDYAEKINAVVIGKDVTGIGSYAFAGTSVKSLIVPQGVKSVGSYALPADATVYAYADTQIQDGQSSGVSVSIYSKSVPETHDRHWTSWGSTGHITDEPFTADAPFWHFDESGKPVEWKKIKVLFIGNSFTFYYQMPKQFDAIAENLGYYVETYSIAVPGQTLETHADENSNSGTEISALLNKVNDFDYVVVQEQSTRPYTEYDKFFNALKALKKKVDDTQEHAQIYLYETWGSPASAGDSYEEIAEMEQKLYEAYTQAATDLSVKVTYVGRAFTYIKGNTDINLYFGDNRHPGPTGSYLSACVHVANMLGGDVRKVSLTGKDLVVISNEGASAQPMNLTEAQCETLRAAAYSTVFESGQTETYTVKFWYNGQVQSEKSAVVGLGFTLPTCTVTGDEKFSGWTLDGSDTVYSPGERIGYAAISENIENGVINFYAQTREMIIAVWGRWITENNFLQVMDGFKTYCLANGYNYDKVGYVYYAGKTQNVDAYFLIADFTNQVKADDADVIFPCGDNISNAAQSNVADMVTESTALGVSLEGNSTRYVAKLNEKSLTQAFYTYITSNEAKTIIGSLS